MDKLSVFVIVAWVIFSVSLSYNSTIGSFLENTLLSKCPSVKLLFMMPKKRSFFLSSSRSPGARFFRPLPIPDEVIPCIFAVSFAALPIPEDPLPILVEEKAHLLPF